MKVDHFAKSFVSNYLILKVQYRKKFLQNIKKTTFRKKNICILHFKNIENRTKSFANTPIFNKIF